MRWRNLLGSLVLLTIWAGNVWSAPADVPAEQFVRQLISEGFSILRDEGLSTGSRQTKFHQFIVGHVDAQRTAMFTLGVYRRNASEETLARFVAAFRDYSTAIYETRLDDYKNATMTVVSSMENKRGDITVIASAEDKSLREPLSVGFRLANSSDRFKIIDVQVAGIWLSVEQREQFGALLSRNGGDIDRLTEELVVKAAELRRASQDE